MLATTHCDPNRAADSVEHRRPAHRRAVDAHLVRAGAQRQRHIVRRSNSAAERERNEQPLRRSPRDIEQRRALIGGGRDVEKDDFVRAFALVARRELHGIADIAQAHELLALHHASALHIETDHHATREHHVTSSPTEPLVLNTPLALSATSAWRSDAPSALNAASTT